VTGRRRQRRKQVLDKLEGKKLYWKLKAEALDRTVWRYRFGGVCGPIMRRTTEGNEEIWKKFKYILQVRASIATCFISACVDCDMLYRVLYVSDDK